jgi:hypothetical protein
MYFAGKKDAGALKLALATNGGMIPLYQAKTAQANLLARCGKV